MKLRVLVAIGLAFLAFPLMAGEAGENGEKLVELKIELPRPLFIGTPMNITSSNLDPDIGQIRGPFMVPEGVGIISRGKSVTASDDFPIIGDLEMVTDGNKEGGDGNFVELAPGPQWVQIDMEEPYEIHGLTIWLFHSQARVFKDVVVMVADDEDFLENVRTIFNNDHDNSSGLGIGSDKEWIETNEGRLITPKDPVVARYVRLHTNGSTASPMNQFTEVEIYGRSPEE